jgi:YesN/AraC family two-component response regulator
MPKMTGVQLAEIIKREWPNVPIIIATGYAEFPPGLGANLPTLSKPFSQRDLAEAVAKEDLKGRKTGRVVKFRGNNRSAE